MKSKRATALKTTTEEPTPKLFKRKPKVAVEIVEVDEPTKGKKKKVKEPTSYDDDITALVAGIKKDIGDVFIPHEGVSSLVEVEDWIPMPQPICDVIGTPGLPCGHVIEVMGAPDCGKTTLVTHALISAQKIGGVAILLDTEHKYHIGRAVAMGLNRKGLIIIRAETTEEAFSKFVTTLKHIIASPKWKDKKIVVAWDSIGATPCKKEIDAEGENFAADSAKALKGGLRRTRYFLSQTKACLLLINQTYEEIGGKSFFKKQKGYGGKGPEYFSTVILSLSRLARLSKQVKGEKVRFGIHTQIEAVKNHLAPPFKQVRVDIDAKGIVYGGRKAGDDA